MIRLRDSNETTCKIDNAYSHADVQLPHAIGRFRIKVGLDQLQPGPNLEGGRELGD